MNATMQAWLPYLWLGIPIVLAALSTYLTLRGRVNRAAALAASPQADPPVAAEPTDRSARAALRGHHAVPRGHHAVPRGHHAPEPVDRKGDAEEVLTALGKQAADRYAARCAPCPSPEAFGRLLLVREVVDRTLYQQRVPNVLLAVSAPVTDGPEGALLPLCEVQGDALEVATLLGCLLLDVSKRPHGEAIVQEAIQWLNGQRSAQIVPSGLDVKTIEKGTSKAN